MGNAETIFQYLSYFTQAMAYPLTWLGGRIRDSLGLNDMIVNALLSALALGTAAFIQREDVLSFLGSVGCSPRRLLSYSCLLATS